jgi:two-component system, OmpR family, sensor histidine kinase VicK
LLVLLPLIWSRYHRKVKEKTSSSLQSLEAEKNKSSLILNAIDDGVMVVDDKKAIRIFNPSAAKLTGWDANDALGIDVSFVLKFVTESNDKPFDESTDPIKKALETATYAHDNNLIMQSKDGINHFVSVGASPILNKSGKADGVVVVFRDVSQEKSEAQRSAEFVSTASHEMRTPVAAIEGYLQLALNDKVSQIDAKARGFLQKALDSTHHLGDLFQDLLTSAKAEDGRLVNHPVVIEMGEYLESLSDGFRFSAEKKNLLMEFVIGASKADSAGELGVSHVVKPLYYVYADPDRLREVITNLFDNGVKYTENGKVSIGLTGNAEVVQLYIRDTGPGIAPEDVPHLFQKFYRVDNTKTRTIGGTGLGLFICRKIIELYQGRIWVESTVGKGSTFYINLPRLSSQKASELQTKESQSIL